MGVRSGSGKLRITSNSDSPKKASATMLRSTLARPSSRPSAVPGSTNQERPPLTTRSRAVGAGTVPVDSRAPTAATASR
jgi:hypothetical protein